jgi:hypothetical protein
VADWDSASDHSSAGDLLAPLVLLALSSGPKPRASGRLAFACRIDFQTAVLVLAARFCARVLRPMRLRTSPRARGTPGVRRTHGLRCVATPKRNGSLGRGRRPVLVEPQVRLLSDVPRAVFEACSARPPVVHLSNHRCWAAVTAWPLDRSYGSHLQEPRDPAVWRCRDRAAWAAARWVCVLHPGAATASRSRLTTPREAPSDGPAWANYESEKSERG